MLESWNNCSEYYWYILWDRHAEGERLFHEKLEKMWCFVQESINSVQGFCQNFSGPTANVQIL
jgi:hypothetical protein